MKLPSTMKQFGLVLNGKSKSIIKKTTEIKEDDKSFERFETLLRKVIKVSKDEILEREKAEKEKKKQRKAKA